MFMRAEVVLLCDERVQILSEEILTSGVYRRQTVRQMAFAVVTLIFWVSQALRRR